MHWRLEDVKTCPRGKSIRQQAGQAFKQSKAVTKLAATPILTSSRQKEWFVGQVGCALTIGNILDLEQWKLSDAERKIIKFEPHWDFILFENYAVALLYIMIGVFNDLIHYLLIW